MNLNQSPMESVDETKTLLLGVGYLIINENP
jgi:hypothetical protein